jgi:hypothetical protein
MHVMVAHHTTLACMRARQWTCPRTAGHEPHYKCDAESLLTQLVALLQQVIGFRLPG